MSYAFFGAPSSQLYASFHQPEARPARSTGVLLCNPFGEEAIRSHRIYRVLATQLARAGYFAMRFDYWGTGDSQGDMAEARLASWLANVRAASDELRQASGVSKQVWFGLRLGGSLAMLAATQAVPGPTHVVLWDPVVDGAGYLLELVEMHKEYMRSELGPRWRSDAPRVLDHPLALEALGHAIAEGLENDISKIDLATLEVKGPQHVTLVLTKQTAATERLKTRLQRGPARLECLPVETSVPWNSDAAMNRAVVPMDILRVILSGIQVHD